MSTLIDGMHIVDEKQLAFEETEGNAFVPKNTSSPIIAHHHTDSNPPESYLDDKPRPAWYVIHTYSGFEENVKHNLLQRIESMDMSDYIFEVMIPTENKVKVKNGKRKTITERIFPGYVLVKMIVTDASWYCVRNTPNVTGFVGTGTVPTPIAESEITDLKKRMGHEETMFILDAQEGDIVKVTDGPFKDYEGKVSQVDETRGKVKVLVSMFGRETPLELDFLQVKKI